MMFKRFAISGALVGAAVVLGSCTVVEEPGRPLPPRPDRPQMCTKQYDPVCAVRGGDRRTFGNACMARAEDFRIVHGGECGPVSGQPPSGAPQACTMEYAPVCAVRGGQRRTFSNACHAEAASYRVIDRGEC